MKKIAILGSTGSIGLSTLNIIRENKRNFKIQLLTTNKNVKKILNQTKNDEIIIKALLSLSLCISSRGYQKLKNLLFD